MEWKREITIRFWTDSDSAIPDNHSYALEEQGFQKAVQMIKEGFSCGELIENICTYGDPEEGIKYNGWWERTSSST